MNSQTTTSSPDGDGDGLIIDIDLAQTKVPSDATHQEQEQVVTNDDDDLAFVSDGSPLDLDAKSLGVGRMQTETAVDGSEPDEVDSPCDDKKTLQESTPPRSRLPQKCKGPLIFLFGLVMFQLYSSQSGIDDTNGIIAVKENDYSNSTTTAAVGQSSSLLGGGSSLLVIQAADEAYATKMQSKMEANRKWADCMNYNYELKTWNKTTIGNPYTGKVKAIHDALESSEENDWILFLDGDVHFKADSCDDAFERMLPAKSTSTTDSQPCEIIAITSSFTINTGVLLLKSAPGTKKLIRRWLELQQRPNDSLLSFGAADQLTLQEAVIENFLGESYGGKCIGEGSQANRNVCFRDHIPEEYRSSGHTCLMPCSEEVPLQCNDCGAECNRTSAIFHHDSKRERHIAMHGFGRRLQNWILHQ